MCTKKAILIVATFLSLCHFASGQTVAFNYLGVKEGLSQNSATSIAQDNLGRIWIGTRDGLNVYDGTEIKTLRPIRGDSTSLLGHFINDIVPDGNTLWIITKNGLSRLNTINLSFTQYPRKEIISATSFRGELLIGTQQGLLYLDSEKNTFIKNPNILSEEFIVQSLYPDRSGILWIGTNKGLFTYNPDQKSTEKILATNTTCVFTDSRKQIWVGTSENGVYLLNNQRRQIAHFTHSEKSSSIVNNIIRDINEDPNGNIWIGTFLGLSIINGENHSVNNFTHSKEDNRSLSHNSVYSILRDKQGSMWLGTYFGGVSYFNPDIDLYKEYPILTKDSDGISFSVVGEMLEDNAKNLWIATEGGGIDYYNRQKGTFKHYRHTVGQAGLSHNNVRALAFIDNNTLLSGTHYGGLNILDIKSGKFTTFLNDENNPSSLPSNVVNEIIAYKDFFLLGTKKGVVKFNPKTYQLSPFFKEDAHLLNEKSINCLLEDSFGILWIGTEEQGLYSYDSKTDKINKYQSSSFNLKTISGDNISCIFEDHQFRLWFGTHGGGLNQFIRKKNEFINYNMAKNNLPSDFIQGIKESRYGNLWIASSKGLSRLDIENDKIYNHSQKNGFPINEINIGALYLTSDGEIFVGGINGLISFNEEELLNRSNNFTLNFTSISVNNREVLPGDDTNILKHDLAYSEKIILRPGQNVFTINYSASNYISTNQNSYQYKLENFDSDWINAGNQTSVTYTNLNPGEYTLHIRGLSGVEETIIDEKSLVIQINPPLYRTWYAIVAYIILAMVLSWWLNQIYRARIILENKIKLERGEKEQIKELNKSKLNFFTNISHEFRTPLTLITGTLESVLEENKSRPGIYKKLVTVHNNAVRLNSLITELLDFRKLEHGKAKLKVSEINLSDFLSEIFHSFTEYALYHEVSYEITPPSPKLSLWFDKVQMEKVVYNLISNAFKFVQDNTGEISLKVIENNNYIDVIITDNGIGMPAYKVKRVFDLYYQIDNIDGNTNRQGSGIGLALCKSIITQHKGDIFIDSKEGEGTTFSIRLQKGNRHFNENDLLPEDQLLEYSAETSPVLLKVIDDQDLDETEMSDKTPTILIVEDNLQVQNLLSDILKSSYKLLLANDGNEGMEMAINQQPDLILSDVMMPNLSGTDMCAKLKRNVRTSHIPIILLTARAAVRYKIEGLETGADDYITKPFNTHILKARVKNVIQNRILLQQKFRQDPKAEIKEITSNSIDQKVLKLAKEIVEQNLDNTEFDVQEFAREMGIGRTRLYAKIKGVTGQTPNEFILSTRLKKAADMLLTNEEEMNVSEIAYSVGFSTPRYFSRCFREHFGVSPSRYGKADSENSEEHNGEN